MTSPTTIQYINRSTISLSRLAPNTLLLASQARPVPAIWFVSYEPKRARSSIGIPADMAEEVLKKKNEIKNQVFDFFSALSVEDGWGRKGLIAPHLLLPGVKTSTATTASGKTTSHEQRQGALTAKGQGTSTPDQVYVSVCIDQCHYHHHHYHHHLFTAESSTSTQRFYTLQQLR